MSQSGLVVDAALPGEFVMPRIRLDGGQLTAGQLRAIGRVARRYARDNVEVTDQQHVRLGQVRIEDAPEAFTRLRAAGLAASPAGEYDAQQVFLGSPVAGIAADEIIDGTPALRAIRDRRSGRAEFSGLPRTFRTVISDRRARTSSMRPATSRSSASGIPPWALAEWTGPTRSWRPGDAVPPEDDVSAASSPARRMGKPGCRRILASCRPCLARTADMSPTW